MKFTIEEKQKEIDMLEKQMETAETEEDILIREAKEAEARRKSLIETLKHKRQIVGEYFLMFSGREITEEEYKKFNEILDNPNTRRGYNIKNFIEGDDGKEREEQDDYNPGDVQKQ